MSFSGNDGVFRKRHPFEKKQKKHPFGEIVFLIFFNFVTHYLNEDALLNTVNVMSQNPHASTVMVRLEDLVFGFVRLASLKYKKQADNLIRFERLMKKHLLPFGLSEEPDIITSVGLGKIDESVPHQQQRAVSKLFMKFSGMDAPEQAMTGEGFLRAVKSLNLPPPGSVDKYLHTVLQHCHNLYSRPVKPTDEISPDDFLGKEVLICSFYLCPVPSLSSFSQSSSIRKALNLFCPMCHLLNERVQTQWNPSLI